MRTKDFDIIIFGEQEGTNLNIENRKVHYFKEKYYGNDLTLRLIYSAADLVVCPSTLEAFGQVAFEAGACETPSIAFKNTGFEDVIEHMQTGYLAKYKNQDDITFGINWVLENNKNNIIGKAARELISKKFSYEKISEEYIHLYKQITYSK